MDKYRVITGTAKEVETEINKLNEKNFLEIHGITATNEQTTVILQVFNER